MDPRPDRSTDLLQVTIVESPACHFCADAHEVLATMVAAGRPLTTTTLSVRTEEGRLLMAQHRAGMSPLVLVDGQFFSQGRLPRRKLEKVLRQRESAQMLGLAR